MSYRIEQVIHETPTTWVLADMDHRCYTVMRKGVTHSTPDSSYPMGKYGLSLAKARADWLDGRRVASATPGPCARVQGGASSTPTGCVRSGSPIPTEVLDRHLDAVLRASGSALRHFSFDKTLNAMRQAMANAMSEALTGPDAGEGGK